MKTIELEKLSKNEMSQIRGGELSPGQWIYLNGEWIYIERYDLGEDNYQ